MRQKLTAVLFLINFFLFSIIRNITITNIDGVIDQPTIFNEHPTVDLMLIKLNDKWTSFPPASVAQCLALKIPFKLVAVGRDINCTYVCV